MKRILALMRRDLLSTSRDHLLVYALLAPLLGALALRLFLPSVGQAAVNVVVTRETPPAVVEQLQPYLDVEVVADRPALERRVLAYDDAVGIVPAPDGGYSLVLEGNESHDSRVLPETVLRKVSGGSDLQVAMAEVGGDQIPFKELIGAFLALNTLFLTSAVMGLLIVEDREGNVLQALGVSPMARKEYVAARGLLALVLSVAVIFGSFWLLGLSAFDPPQLLAATVAGSLASALAGFLLGALSSNQIAGIANIKFGSLLFLLPAILSFLIPERFSAALYWLPTYWSFVCFKAILLEAPTWGALLPMLLWNLVAGMAFVAVCYPWLKGRLDFARG